MIRGLFLLLVVAVLLGGGFFVYNNVVSNNTPGTDSTVQVSPDVTVEEFYQWYLDYKGQALISGAYKESPFLTDSYKKKLEDKASGYKNLLYDPILCAQDRPKDSNVENVTLSNDGTSANVVYYEDYYGTPVRTSVSLVSTSGNWSIDNIECVVPEAPEKDLERQVIIYFFNGSRDPVQKGKTTYTGVYGVARMLDDGVDRYKGAMTKLFEGTTGPEKAQGFTTVLTSDMLRNFFVLGSKAYVDFDPVIKEIEGDESAWVNSARQQIEATLKHSHEIEEVYYAINNDPVEFYVWSGIGCPQEDAPQEQCTKRPFNDFGKEPGEEDTMVNNSAGTENENNDNSAQ